MKLELRTVLIVQGVRKPPITVFINQNELDIDYRVSMVIDCYKRAHKVDAEINKEQKAAALHLLEVMRTAIHGAAHTVPVTTIAADDVALEYQIYTSQFKDEE